MKKPIFLIKNINLDALHLKFNIKNLVKEEQNKTNHKLNLNKDDENHFSFLDESKMDHRCVITMKNFLNKDLIPESTTLYCFWCRHSFNYKPIGCPIDYVPPRISKSYHSEITKDKYILRENITPIQLKELDTLNNLNENEFNEFSIIDNDFYVTDGLFCSFNCTLAYIKLNHDNPLYINSECLLNKMYFDTFGGNCIPLIEAPSWRLLKNYGGHMDIEEYRKNFFKVNYLNIDNIVYPKTKCVGYVFEKQIKL